MRPANWGTKKTNFSGNFAQPKPLHTEGSAAQLQLLAVTNIVI